jgi:hypothetical protein
LTHCGNAVIVVITTQEKGLKQMTLTAKFKKNVKEMFAKAYGYSTGTVFLIKKVFPKFEAKHDLHWYNLIDRCEQKIQANEFEALTNERKLWISINELGYGIKTGKFDSFMRDEYVIIRSDERSHHSLTLGAVGFSHLHQRWYFSTRTGNFFATSLENALEIMMIRTGLQRLLAA